MVGHFLEKGHLFNDFVFTMLYVSKLTDPQMIQRDLLRRVSGFTNYGRWNYGG